MKKKFDFKNLKIKGRDFLVHSHDLLGVRSEKKPIKVNRSWSIQQQQQKPTLASIKNPSKLFFIIVEFCRNVYEINDNEEIRFI